MKPVLSPRPRGIRKSWRLQKWSASDVAQYLRDRNPLVKLEWGEPVEWQVWVERGGYIRKVCAYFTEGKGMIASFTYRSNGDWVANVRHLP